MPAQNPGPQPAWSGKTNQKAVPTSAERPRISRNNLPDVCCRSHCRPANIAAAGSRCPWKPLTAISARWWPNARRSGRSRGRICPRRLCPVFYPRRVPGSSAPEERAIYQACKSDRQRSVLSFRGVSMRTRQSPTIKCRSVRQPRVRRSNMRLRAQKGPRSLIRTVYLLCRCARLGHLNLRAECQGSGGPPTVASGRVVLAVGSGAWPCACPGIERGFCLCWLKRLCPAGSAWCQAVLAGARYTLAGKPKDEQGKQKAGPGGQCPRVHGVSFTLLIKRKQRPSRWKRTCSAELCFFCASSEMPPAKAPRPSSLPQ